MWSSSVSVFYFTILYFIGNLPPPIFCTSSQQSDFNINIAHTTPMLHFDTDNFANIIAKVLHSQRVEPLFFQLAAKYEAESKSTPTTPQYANEWQYGTPTSPPVEGETSDKFPYLVTPKFARFTRATKVQDDVDDATKVLDGVDAKMGEFPFLASIKFRGKHGCGGSIIDSNHLLSAAHCFSGRRNLSEYTVSVGEYDLKVMDRYEQTLTIEHICIHANYTSTDFGNDIAIIRLADRIQFFRGIVQRAPLPPRDGEVVDVRRGTADIVGWGNTGTLNGITLRPNLLQTTYVKLYKVKDCDNLLFVDEDFYRFRGDPASIVCAGDDNDGRARDVCAGDSGGPIICSGVVCGLVSYGLPCSDDDKSKRGVYTRVHYFRDWISNYALDGEGSQCRKSS